jgi:hypothetical protein
MTGKSTLDPDNFPTDRRRGAAPRGHDVGSLGPSDSSDTGSDLSGALPNTGDDLHLERGADEDALSGHTNDINTDRIVGAEEAGLGGGLDQAEEAQLGVKDDDRLVGSSNDRLTRIAEAAYYRAQRRGFEAGGEDEDWLEAEKEVDADR